MADGIVIGQPIVNNAVGEDYLAIPNIDAKYGPYSSVQEALSSLAVDGRAIGLTIGIRTGNELKEYWFKGGTADSNLVLKQTDVDLSNYDTSAQVDNKIKKAVDNIDVGGGSNSPYTRAHMRKLHIKISGLPTSDFKLFENKFKYGAENILSFTCDDANTSALSVVWAGINKRPVSIHSADTDNPGDKTYQYHANQYLADDIPDDIVYRTEPDGSTYPNRATYNTPFGHELMKVGVAIWPYATNHDGNFMDRTITVDKDATNLYRFMVPYLVWEDCNLLKRYGFDFYFHNIGTERYGASSDIYNVIQGLEGDMARTKEMIGRTMKIIARPDGNNVYMDAMLEMPKIDMAVAENSPAKVCIPYNVTDWFHTVWQRVFNDDVNGYITDEIGVVFNAPIEEKEWFHWCCHTADKKWVTLLYDVSDTLYQALDIKLWFPTVGELYEYMYYAKHNRILNFKCANGVLEFDYEFTYKDNFNYKEMTLAFSSETANSLNLSALSLEVKDANDSAYVCPIQQLSVYEGKVWLLVGVEESIIENIEYFVSKYEETENTVWKDDAELQLLKIDKARRDAFQTRINNIVSPIPITSLSIPNEQVNITSAAPIDIVVTYTPANATNTQDIKLVYGGYSNDLTGELKSAVDGKATFTLRYKSDAGGGQTMKFKVEGTSIESNTVNVSTVAVNIESLSIPEGTKTISRVTPLRIPVSYLPANAGNYDKIVAVFSHSDVYKTELLDAGNGTANFLISIVGTPKGTGVLSFKTTTNNNITSNQVTLVPVDENIPITEIVVTPTSLQLTNNEPKEFVAVFYPNDNTEMDKVMQYDSPNVITTVKSTFGNVITYSVVGIQNNPGVYTDELVIDIDGNAAISASVAYELTVIDTQDPDRFKFCCAAYQYATQGSVLYINDDLYGGTVNYEDFNDSNAYVPHGGKIMSTSGNELPVTRNKQVPSILVTELGEGVHTYAAAAGSSNANGDLTSIFDCNPEYKYFYQYNKILGGGCAFSVPSGKYRIRLLSSTTEANDAYNNGGRVFINKIDVTSQLPTTAYQQKNEWTPWIDTTVSDGIFSIIVLTEKSKRVGINAFEIERIE